MLNISYSDLQCFKVIESCANIHPVNGVLKGLYNFFILNFFLLFKFTTSVVLKRCVFILVVNKGK